MTDLEVIHEHLRTFYGVTKNYAQLSRRYLPEGCPPLMAALAVRMIRHAAEYES